MYLKHPKESQTGQKRMRNNYVGLRKELSLGLGEQTAKEGSVQMCVLSNSPHTNDLCIRTLHTYANLHE